MLYTKEDLEQAYIEGYNSACDELESMLEDSNNEEYTALELAIMESDESTLKDNARAIFNRNVRKIEDEAKHNSERHANDKSRQHDDTEYNRIASHFKSGHDRVRQGLQNDHLKVKKHDDSINRDLFKARERAHKLLEEIKNRKDNH